MQRESVDVLERNRFAIASADEELVISSGSSPFADVGALPENCALRAHTELSVSYYYDGLL